MERLARKHRASRNFVPAPIIERRPGATFAVVTIGGCDLAAREAMDLLAAEGYVGDFMRVRGFPFSEEVEELLAAHDKVFVVEQNRDAQLRALLVLETRASKEKLKSILPYSGFPLQAAQVVHGVRSRLALGLSSYPAGGSEHSTEERGE
jgi:2-oxoglutarate ferredoxin oxidoreductase subunit alpha